MRNILPIVALALPLLYFAIPTPPPIADDAAMVRRIFDEALANGQAHDHLRILCKDIGHRLSGSPQAAKAVVWGQQTLRTCGMDTVFLQPVMVPHWERGAKESCEMLLNGKRETLDIMALGGSIGGKVSGEVVEVQNFDELKALGTAIKGKIVFFNRPFLVTEISGFRAYGGCVNQRVDGASQAAAFGAIGVLVRSMTHALDRYPHTGVMHYADTAAKIPAAAVSTLSCRRLHEVLAAGAKVRITLTMHCQVFPDAPSHNVVGELRGSQSPNEYIVVGGHLDSWDIGEGAHDDGAGVAQSIEALRILKAIGYQPKHTLRAILFMNEENGARGAAEYAALAKSHGEKHLFAMESDRGGFTPRGFAVQDTGAMLRHVQQFKALLAPYGFTDWETGHGGVDVGPLAAQGTTLIGYMPDSQRYFDHHHAQTDVFESVHKRELLLGAAGMAALIYLLDNYPTR